jgi:hypothetical protein
VVLHLGVQRGLQDALGQPGQQASRPHQALPALAGLVHKLFGELPLPCQLHIPNNGRHVTSLPAEHPTRQLGQPPPTVFLTLPRWGDTLGDEVVAAATIDRLVHHAHVIAIDADSYRTRAHRAAKKRTPK